MPKPSKRDQLVEATKELLWEVVYEAMSPRDIQARSAAKPGSLRSRKFGHKASGSLGRLCHGRPTESPSEGRLDRPGC